MRKTAVVILCALLPGCGGGGNTPELATVKGTVKLDGQPLPEAKVMFRPVEGGRPSFGRTDENGAYALEYSPGHPGAVPGKHKVEISTYSSDEENKVPEKVPTKYNTDTQLEAEVKEGSNEINFEDLDSSGNIQQPDMETSNSYDCCCS